MSVGKDAGTSMPQNVCLQDSVCWGVLHDAYAIARSKLDYCNSLYTTIFLNLEKSRLQHIQNFSVYVKLLYRTGIVSYRIVSWQSEVLRSISHVFLYDTAAMVNFSLANNRLALLSSGNTKFFLPVGHSTYSTVTVTLLSLRVVQFYTLVHGWEWNTISIPLLLSQQSRQLIVRT